MFLLLGGSLLLALVTNLSFEVHFGNVLAEQQAPWSAIFPFDHPEFQERLWQSARPLVWAPYKIFELDRSAAWILMLVAGVVAAYWFSTIRERADSPYFMLSALTPSFVALALVPLKLWNVAALAEQGLRNPVASGELVGGALGMIYAGALLSLILIVIMLCSRTRSVSDRGNPLHSPAERKAEP